MKFKQRGYIRFEGFEFILWLAGIGLLAVFVAGIYGLWWLVTNVRFA